VREGISEGLANGAFKFDKILKNGIGLNPAFPVASVANFAPSDTVAVFSFVVPVAKLASRR
jgi:hypothetical protein